MKKQLVIYTRYSSDMQSPKSCADQERDVRQALTRLGIDHRLAVVIHDEAESGTKTFRAEAERLDEMSRKGEIGILSVDDQTRFTRADNAYNMITDLVFHGGRFISTGEGIDTTQQGWELRVKVMELHNSTTIRELGRRVRRGQRGRLLARLTAGDYPYGYESFIVHPEKFVPNGRGPKPEKDLRIKDVEADWVRQIFLWFIIGWSLTKIAEELMRQRVAKGHRQRTKPWTHQQVRGILSNPKYIGEWVLGVPKLQLIDHDEVTRTNITSQGYLTDDIGRPKVQATGDACHQIEHLLAIEEIHDRYRRTQETGPNVFCCVDSISSRAAIWRALQIRCDFWADGRMLGENIRVLVADARQGREHYPTTLFAQGEAQAGSCTSRSTIYAANLAAALLVHQFVRHLRGDPLDHDATFNLAAGEYVVLPVAV